MFKAKTIGLQIDENDSQYKYLQDVKDQLGFNTVNYDTNFHEIDLQGNLSEKHFKKNYDLSIKWLLKRIKVKENHRLVTTAFLDDRYNGKLHILLANYGFKYKAGHKMFKEERDVIVFSMDKHTPNPLFAAQKAKFNPRASSGVAYDVELSQKCFFLQRKFKSTDFTIQKRPMDANKRLRAGRIITPMEGHLPAVRRVLKDWALYI